MQSTDSQQGGGWTCIYGIVRRGDHTGSIFLSTDIERDRQTFQGVLFCPMGGDGLLKRGKKAISNKCRSFY